MKKNAYYVVEKLEHKMGVAYNTKKNVNKNSCEMSNLFQQISNDRRKDKKCKNISDFFRIFTFF